MLEENKNLWTNAHGTYVPFQNVAKYILLGKILATSWDLCYFLRSIRQLPACSVSASLRSRYYRKK